MRALLACLALAFPVTAMAQTTEDIPPGCYVAFSNPNFCFNSNAQFLRWDTIGDTSFLMQKYGSVATAMIQTGEGHRQDAAFCKSSLDQCSADRDGARAAFSENEANRQQWIAYGQAQARLVSKLRRACGKACKKVK